MKHHLELICDDESPCSKSFVERTGHFVVIGIRGDIHTFHDSLEAAQFMLGRNQLEHGIFKYVKLESNLSLIKQELDNA